MIKTGGENVASREVEEAIYQMDGVAEVAVFGAPHPRWVEAVVAVVVPKPGATLTEEAVITHTRGLLAGYKTPSASSSPAPCRKTPAARSSNANSATSTTTSPHGCDARQPRADSPDQGVPATTQNGQNGHPGRLCLSMKIPHCKSATWIEQSALSRDSD